MLFAAGAGDRVVGTSAYSDEPDAAKRIERIGDSQSFDLERVLALHPDVVVVWSGGTPPLQIARLERAGLRIYHQHVARLDAIPDSVRRLGQLTGTDAQAQAAATELTQRISALRSRYSPSGPSGPGGSNGPHAGATVLIQLWDRPIYTVGRDELITDVIHVCGFRSAFEDLADVSPAVSIESVLARDPDIILALTPDQNAPSMAAAMASPQLHEGAAHRTGDRVVGRPADRVRPERRGCDRRPVQSAADHCIAPRS
jgi:iron complex transport system substrate-binding protein